MQQQRGSAPLAQSTAAILLPTLEAFVLVKFSTLAGGVFIEVGSSDEYRSQDRCFRFDANGNAEWASFADLAGSNPAPRWFGHVFKEKDFIFA